MMKERGYVALLAVLIVGAVATAIGVTLLIIGVDSQRSASVITRSIQARSLASTCAEQALQVIHDDTNYTGSGNLILAGGTCSYTVTNTGGATRSIALTGTMDTVLRRATVTITIGSSITVNSWSETQ
jgi:hypothetical protein